MGPGENKPDGLWLGKLIMKASFMGLLVGTFFFLSNVCGKWEEVEKRRCLPDYEQANVKEFVFFVLDVFIMIWYGLMFWDIIYMQTVYMYIIVYIFIYTQIYIYVYIYI